MTRVRRGLARRAPSSAAVATTSTPPVEPSPPSRSPLARVESLLPAAGGRLTVILADDTLGEDLAGYLEAATTERVVVVSPEALPEWELEEAGVEHQAAATLDEVNWLLRFTGPVDLLVDAASATAAEHDATWRKLFFHLRPKGAYALRRASVTDGGVPSSMTDVAPWIGVPSSAQQGRSSANRELALATGQLSIATDHVVAVKRNRHLLKVREANADRILARREPALAIDELLRLPAGSFQIRGKVTSHESGVEITGLPEVITYPEHHLRHYRGKIAMVSNALMHHGFSALPDSFRHHLSDLRNPRLVHANGDFARVPANLRPTRTLTGTYYHLDSENSGHYGHLMTEVISRLWGWEAAKKQIPDLKAIFRIRYPNERDPELERRVFEAYGIAREDIVWVDEPVWLESVVAATPMWHNQIPHYVHPDLADVWARLRDHLRVPLGSTDPARRLFVSRRDITGNRSCRNTRAVEDFFRARGFDVVYPELFDLGMQAAMFAEADVVAGFGGSAVFNILFSSRLKTLILLNHEAYTARNEHLYAANLGTDVHYFWSTPDVQHPEGGWTEEAYYSSWEFDFARNEQALDEVLAQLPD